MANTQQRNLKNYMVPNISFSDNRAFSIAKFSSYEKGREYFEDGLVEKIWKEGNEYKAIVQGTNQYKVSMRFEDEELIYECSCPYELGGACKHVVAAILAFSKDKKYALEKPNVSEEKAKITAEKLLEQTTDSQIRTFLRKFLLKNPEFIDDLEIFLQGQKQTPTTLLQYKTKFKNELDELHLTNLIQVWYSMGDDYYDEGGYNPYADEKTLTDIVDNASLTAQKYFENQNWGEVLKIYQALFEAFGEKKAALKGEEEELEDWFFQEMEKAINSYIDVLKNAKSREIKRIGIVYLCFLFENKHYDFEQDSLLLGLKQIIISEDEAKKALAALTKIASKDDLSISESSLLADLYLLIEDYQQFERISIKNLKKNPNLALDLLKYYQKKGLEKKVIEVSTKVLHRISKFRDDYFSFQDPINYQELEIQIRRFLKTVYSINTDYQDMIANLEWLFLLTTVLSDYKELAKAYRSTKEKEFFWQNMKEYFLKKYDVQTIFKVFRYENKTGEIIKLLEDKPDSECFPDMVSFVQADYADRCFSAYKKKIEKLLLEAKTTKYPEAVYHLKRMRQIGKDKEFIDFLNWIKTAYWRRRRLMEEIENGL